MPIRRATFHSPDGLRQHLTNCQCGSPPLGGRRRRRPRTNPGGLRRSKGGAPHHGAPFTAHNAPGFPGTSATAPFNECPQIGYDASCGLLIVVSNNGEQVLQDNNNQASGVAADHRPADAVRQRRATRWSGS